MRYIGVDPGRTGALVVIDDQCVVQHVQRWKRHDAPPVLELCYGSVVAIERPFVGRSSASTITLAEWIGSALEQIRHHGCEILRPTATQWRAKIFGTARMRREEAKRAARLAAPWAATDDEAEAYLMAKYALGWHMAFKRGGG